MPKLRGIDNLSFKKKDILKQYSTKSLYTIFMYTLPISCTSAIIILFSCTPPLKKYVKKFAI